ncbi:MAG: bacteriocin [Prolixibacteraceae bacterium]|jgi:bacteriocin-like protein|nr:bacteriocin [Prolixibacteraceae bacterium]
MKELNFEELRTIEGGASFAYRIGQLLRGVFMSAGNPFGYCNFISGCLINEEEANKK